jgi:hypothetical protein
MTPGHHQHMGRTFIAVRHRPLDAVDRIAGHGIVLAEIIPGRRRARGEPTNE